MIAFFPRLMGIAVKAHTEGKLFFWKKKHRLIFASAIRDVGRAV